MNEVKNWLDFEVTETMDHIQEDLEAVVSKLKELKVDNVSTEGLLELLKDEIAEMYAHLTPISWANSIKVQYAKASKKILAENINSVPWFITAFLFARYFPPYTSFLSTIRGRKIYVPANFGYDADLSHFDNTILTYGTDMVLATLTGYMAQRIVRVESSRHSSYIGTLGASLMSMYSIATFAGALCHIFLSDINHMNSWYFRVMWKLCSGIVAVAGGVVGAIGSELISLEKYDRDSRTYKVPQVPQAVWILWSLFFLCMVFLGRFSMKQPAADLFLIAASYTTPILYLSAALYSRRNWKSFNITNGSRQVFLFGALANAPLLIAYDLFNAIGLPLGVINFLLHTNLGITWLAQGYSLLRFKEGLTIFDKVSNDETE